MAANDVPCCEPMFWFYLTACFALVAFAGLMSGLTLGLMSLSLVELEVIVKAGEPNDRKNAGQCHEPIDCIHTFLLNSFLFGKFFCLIVHNFKLTPLKKLQRNGQKRSSHSLRTSIFCSVHSSQAMLWRWRYHAHAHIFKYNSTLSFQLFIQYLLTVFLLLKSKRLYQSLSIPCFQLGALF